MLAAVHCKLGGSVEGQSGSFADDSSIASWAKSSVYFMARHNIIVGTGNNRFSPQRSAQRQSCLIMALRMFQTLNPCRLTRTNCPRRLNELPAGGFV